MAWLNPDEGVAENKYPLGTSPWHPQAQSLVCSNERDTPRREAVASCALILSRLKSLDPRKLNLSATEFVSSLLFLSLVKTILSSDCPVVEHSLGDLMEAEALQAVVKIAGIGGVALLVLWFVYRAIIGKDIFPRLSRTQSLSLLRWIIGLTFVAVIVGIGAYVYIVKPPRAKPLRVLYRSSVSAAATRQPVKGAEISVIGRADIGVQTSNEQGSFSFELPTVDGKFQGALRVRHPDYDVAEKTIELQADTTGEPFMLALKPLPEREWSGVVRDARGVGVSGVTVAVEGGGATTQTAPDGRFSMKATTRQAANFVLRIERDGKVLWRDFQEPGHDITIALDQTKE